MATTQATESEAKGQFRDYRMTTDRYLRLVESGIFTAKDRVFLWRGRLVEKMTKGRRHSFSAVKLDRLLDRLVPGGFHVELEQPVLLGDDSVPEPDVMVLRGTLDEYRDRMPTARDVVLIVEVADSSLAEDSRDALRAYAAEGIPIYWIVNIPEGRFEVHGDLTGRVGVPSYRECRHYGRGDEVPVILDGREVGRVAVRDVLP